MRDRAIRPWCAEVQFPGLAPFMLRAFLAAWHDTLAAMALQSIPDPNSKGQSDD